MSSPSNNRRINSSKKGKGDESPIYGALGNKHSRFYLSDQEEPFFDNLASLDRRNRSSDVSTQGTSIGGVSGASAASNSQPGGSGIENSLVLQNSTTNCER
jgi:hypothetical protein